jgi:CDP-diacylglycerol---glycerol-3-phosphate 3-phosphatidyltransferase
MNLPNIITVARIGLAVVVVPLLLVDSFGLRIAAFVIFVAAALSDIWDGYLARSQGLVTDLGKLLDPLADKLLLAATLIPFYFLSHGVEPQTPFPWFGGVLPLWIVVVIFGRELFITFFRGFAARRGVIIPAGQSGKFKTIFQLVAIGSAILWYALHSASRTRDWPQTTWWEPLQQGHFALTVITLSVAVLLTIYSMLVYLWQYRSLVTAADTPPK